MNKLFKNSYSALIIETRKIPDDDEEIKLNNDDDRNAAKHNQGDAIL